MPIYAREMSQRLQLIPLSSPAHFSTTFYHLFMPFERINCNATKVSPGKEKSGKAYTERLMCSWLLTAVGRNM